MLDTLLRQIIQLNFPFQTHSTQTAASNQVRMEFHPQKYFSFPWPARLQFAFSAKPECLLLFCLDKFIFINYFDMTVMIKQVIPWLEWKQCCSFDTNVRISLILVWVWTQTQVYNTHCWKNFVGKKSCPGKIRQPCLLITIFTWT